MMWLESESRKYMFFTVTCEHSSQTNMSMTQACLRTKVHWFGNESWIWKTHVMRMRVSSPQSLFVSECACLLFSGFLHQAKYFMEQSRNQHSDWCKKLHRLLPARWWGWGMWRGGGRVNAFAFGSSMRQRGGTEVGRGRQHMGESGLWSISEWIINWTKDGWPGLFFLYDGKDKDDDGF